MELFSYERRRSRRYPVALRVSCKRIARGLSLYSGTGTTRNMSSTGLFFEADQSLNTGDYVELLIRWPAGHQTMHVLGRVVRSGAEGTAVEILHHKFAERASARPSRKRVRGAPQEGLS
jgi:hypothetical protein